MDCRPTLCRSGLWILGSGAKKSITGLADGSPKINLGRIGLAYDAERARELLRIGSGHRSADFREGQEDAIRHIVEGKGRLLVVQKTGWGKSFVYFIATKLLRESGGGPSVLISPLLSLMRNQIEAAERMGLRAALISSENNPEWQEIEARFARG